MFQTNLFIYSILYFFLLVLYLPAVLFQALFRGKKTRILDRIRPGLKVDESGGKRKKIWVHAVSVGEVNAALALIRKLLRNNYIIFLSTTTVTGQQVAQSALGDAASIFYFPLDFKIICRAFLSRIRPDAIALMETEIWPNFLETARKSKVPVIFINGRISDHSYKNYLRISAVLNPVFKRIDLMCMQSKVDADRIMQIGAPAEIIRITGNMKFDYSLEVPEDKRLLQDQVGSMLRRGPGSQIWICGSTKPDEEELISEIYCNLRKAFPSLSLLIAPRHPHRGEEVAGIFRKKGFSTLQRSLMQDKRDIPGNKWEVIVLDTVGELACLYRIADLVFMGGSLVPTGGQNVIEPAFFGKPIIFGPSMTNFREIAEIFKARKAAVQVRSPRELEKQMHCLLPDETERALLGRNALQVLEDNRGAVERNLEVIKGIVDD